MTTHRSSPDLAPDLEANKRLVCRAGLDASLQHLLLFPSCSHSNTPVSQVLVDLSQVSRLRVGRFM